MGQFSKHDALFVSRYTIIILPVSDMLQDKRRDQHSSTSSSFKHNENHCKTMQARPLNSRPISV